MPLASLGTLFLLSGCGDPSGPNVIIGPDTLNLRLQYTSYLGGVAEDLVRDVALDAQGNLYVAGGTESVDFPVTPGAFDVSYNASGSFLSDAYVTKLSPSGQLLWSTFLGGPDFDRVYGIEVDPAGFVYVAGRAGGGFPVTPGTVQTVFAGSTHPEGSGPTDGFVCKLRADSGQVVFCTYLGNQDFVFNRDIAVDASQDILLATTIGASDVFPASWFANSFHQTRGGGRDAVIIKLRGDGTGVEWATLIGGSGEENPSITVRVDATGIYVAFATTSPNLPTPNGFDHTLNGTWDVYMAKLSLDGSQLIYGTYVGGSGNEITETHHLAIDQQGNAFMAVGSTSNDAPTTPGSFQPGSGGGTDILIVKVGSSGSLLAGTYVGGSDNEAVEGVGVDPSGNVYFTGGTLSSDFPVTGGQSHQGGTDLLAVALSPDLKQLRFSQLLGGNANETGRGVAVNANAFAVGGVTTSADWPVSAAFQAALRGGMESVVAKFLRIP